MRNNDAKLIQRVLAGDDAAFAELVKKYRKPVHALAWRKVGDFHVAEEITQDTFLKAYQKLATLKEPQSFVSWLYVIATRRCIAWLRKKRLWTQSLEAKNSVQFEKATYSGYIVEENERTATAAQREVVKELLAKLQESERTVMILHYFGEMTCEEISKFLGVSVGAVKSRLSRARHRLKKEEPMIREALEHFQMTPNLTENIMREISRLKPAAPSGGKPLVPWATATFTLVVVFLMLGAGNQYLSRFQKPYSFDAASEMKVELIDALVVLNLESEPDVRMQLGNANAPVRNNGAVQQPDEILFAAAQTEGEDISDSKQQWAQAEPARGTWLTMVFATPEGELYIVDDDLNMHKLSADGKKWQHISDMGPLDTNWAARSLVAKWNDTYYVVPSDQLFASTDGGVTWDLRYSWQEGRKYWNPVELVLTDQAFYLAFENGIFRSEDGGKTWEAMNDGLAAGKIVSLVVIQNTVHLGTLPVFAGTEGGLYRLEGGGWQHLELPVPAKVIRSVAVAEKRLYVSVELDWDQIDLQKADREQQRTWWMFRSTDFGNSWEDITPTNAWPIKGRPPWIQLVAVGETLLASEDGGIVRSTDGGDTWLAPQPPGTSFPFSPIYAAATVAENTIYVAANTGLYRTTNSGESWDLVNIGRHGQVLDLVAFKETSKGRDTPTILYGRVAEEIMKTTDAGHSWKAVHAEIPMKVPVRNPHPPIVHVTKSGGVLYAKGSSPDSMDLYRVSADGNRLVPVQEIPRFNSGMLRTELSLRRMGHHDILRAMGRLDLQGKSLAEQLQKSFPGATQFFKQLETDPTQTDRLVRGGLRGAFAVSDGTFYMEYNFKLFRWEPGDTEWYDTELEETAELDVDVWHKIMEGFTLTVSGNTVYVGKRDGHLVVSFDRGNNWVDLTPILPFPVKVFKEIVFAGSTVYVATDAGVATSSDGKRWQAITDAARTHLSMERLAVDGTNVYGASETSVYRLKNDGVTWKQLTPEVPDIVTSLAVDRNVLYVGTQSSGMLHFTVNEK
ncbi:MAG: sigma-70 family RNA polymerase sigma factor [Candidatus Poribacteria bacterium]|nr:sigma-70 family RNA polymerase sigma factor [Candidatus Poribacteria bacterium]